MLKRKLDIVNVFLFDYSYYIYIILNCIMCYVCIIYICIDIDCLV